MMSAEWFVVLLVLAPCVRSYTEGYTELDGCNEGVIQTENFPGHYPPYATYVWNITVKAGFKVKFNFDMFCIESSPNSCSHDSVTIFYGSHVHDQPYCGDNVPPGPFISSGTNLRVEFRTNEDVSGCGFNGTYGPTVDTNPCQNEGYPTGCTCSCLPGLVGTYCERKSVCHPNPCENGGTCVAHDNGGGDQYRCKCVQGLTGHNCSQPKAPQLKLKHPGKKTVKQGDTIHFLCHWHSHLTPDHYRLFRNRSEVQKSKSGHFCVTLTSSDIGCIVFTCTVEINGRESVHSNGIVIIVKGGQIKKKDKSKKHHQKSHRQDKKSKSGGSRSSKERNSSPSHQDRKSPHRILMTPKSPVKVHSVKGSGHSSPKSSKSPES